MCITLHASELTGTRLYAGEAERDGRYVHVLGYQNDAKNLAPGPNAMVLPIPSAMPMSSENAIDTRSFKSFLSDIADATKAHMFSSRGIALNGLSEDDDLEVFDVGSYTVVLGTKMGAAVGAAASLPKEKRPKLNPAVLSAMAGMYPGWAFAICCWEGSIQAEPLLWWYEPKAPGHLFAPAVDAHDGGAPKETDVSVDTIVTFGSTRKPTGPSPIHYSEAIPAAIRALLPTYAVGQQIQARIPNGDFWYPVKNFTGRTEDDAQPEAAIRMFPGLDRPRMAVPLGMWS